MTDTEALKQRVRDAIDDHDDTIYSLADSVHAEPELGYKETETTRKVAEQFRELGLDVETELAVTGARARAGSCHAEDEFIGAISPSELMTRWSILSTRTHARSSVQTPSTASTSTSPGRPIWAT